MKIGIDLDDVVIEYVEGLKDFYNLMHFERLHLSDIKEWDLKKSMKKSSSPEAMQALMSSFAHHEHFKNLPPVPGAAVGIKKLIANGDTPYFITSRNEDVSETTYDWLHRKDLPIERVYFAKNKANLVDKLGVKIHIDDSPDHLDRIQMECEPKVSTICYDRPWNRRALFRTAHYRVKNWEEILKTIEEIKAHP